MIIELDAGHGGYDSGATSLDKSQLEKNWTLRISNKVSQLLKDAGVNVKTVRTTDTAPGGADSVESSKRKNVELKARVQKAINDSADLFVSFHLNATVGGSGAEAHVYKTSSQNTRNIAAELVKAVDKYLGTHGEPVKVSDFYVIRQTPMPSILLEVCYIDNESDVSRLTTYFDNICRDIANVLIKYAGGKATAQPAKSNDWDGHPFESSIKKAMKSGVIGGTGKTTFSPDTNLTRGQLAAILDRAGLLDGAQ